MALRNTMRLSDLPAPTSPRHNKALRAGVILLLLATAWVMWPFWPWLTLAAWFAALSRPLVERFAQTIKGKRAAAAIVTMLLLVILFAPLVGVAIALSNDAVQLIHEVRETGSGRAALIAFVSPETNAPAGDVSLDMRELRSMIEGQGAQALTFASSIAGATADFAIGMFVFFTAAFFFLTDGPRSYEWIERHTPIEHRHAMRFSQAFVETGRGLLVGVCLTGLLQAVVATATYALLGVPRAIVLGVITFAASFIPSIGTALVWVPVAAGLALTGKTAEAAILTGVGAVIVGSIDNILRPVFARWGALQMHSFVVLLSMFGGLAAVGGWGLMLGPLVVRLAIEGLRIAKEEELV